MFQPDKNTSLRRSSVPYGKIYVLPSPAGGMRGIRSCQVITVRHRDAAHKQRQALLADEQVQDVCACWLAILSSPQACMSPSTTNVKVNAGHCFSSPEHGQACKTLSRRLRRCGVSCNVFFQGAGEVPSKGVFTANHWGHQKRLRGFRFALPASASMVLVGIEVLCCGLP